MTSLEEKWGFKVTQSLAEIFQPHWEIPHKGILEITRELEKTMGKEKALELIGNVAERLIKQQVEEMLKENPINSFEDFLQLFQSTSDDQMWDKVSVDEYKRVEGNVRVSKTVACLYADVWKEWGASDVGYAWNCAIDYTFIESLHPNLRFETAEPYEGR